MRIVARRYMDFCAGRKRRLSKDYGFVSVNQYPVFHVPAYGAREYDFFEVAAFADEIFDCVAMRYTDYVLLDDGAVVEDFSNVVAGGADQFDSAFECLMIRPRANERRKKRVMNVYDPLRIFIHEVVRQDLHVAGQHHEVGLMLRDQRMYCRFGLILIVLGYRDDGVRNLVEIRDGLIVGMIGNDQGDVASQFTALMAIEKVDEAVIVFRDKDNHPRAARRLRQAPIHVELLGDGREVLVE